jgi:superfamily I DNA/RNA helicase
VGGVDSMSTGVAKSDYNYAFSDIAILVRTNQIAGEISKQLKLKGIPVLLSNGTSFLSEPPFDTITYMLQLLKNNKNIVALSGLLTNLSKIDESQKQNILKKYIENKLQLSALSESESWRKWVELYAKLQNEEELEKILLELLDAFLPISILTEQEQYKRESLIKLASEANKNANEFLTKYILSPYTDAGRINSGGVRLLTFHAAKGLEFPITIIAGTEEGITPIERKNVNIEEERRLFYVAVTRSKDELIFTQSNKRMVYGSEKEMAPSRFINEFDRKYIQEVKFEIKAKQKSQDKQLSLF